MSIETGFNPAGGAAPGPWKDVGNDTRRRILTHSPDMMVCEVSFGPDGVGPLHHHVHLQAVYVKSGRFEFDIGGVKREVSAGDALVIPSNVPHGCTILEPGTLIDTFTPARLDFLKA